jgi:D-beta-D-heptose 7-phosphate kinase/D-beta-D-heptose 1-phosphate adenosyltransferase
MSKKKTICVSGGFDPVHIGHLRMMQEAAQYGEVIAIVNSDEWLMRKKGYIFMPFKERCEILEGFSCVSATTHVKDDPIPGLPGPGPVTEALERVKPDYFANGGDRKNNNTPEMDLCQKIGIELVWAVGGGKIQSSSTLVNDSGMVKESAANPDDPDLIPTRVEILTAGDVAKNGDY